MENIQELRTAVENVKVRSAWMNGVKQYALELIDSVAENYGDDVLTDRAKLKAAMLNGAKDWKQYSNGGCSLCYDGDIAERLCTKSELKSLIRKDGSYRNPNGGENWLECQARALCQAANMVLDTAFGR